MKKIVNLVKSGVTYQVGAITQNEFDSLAGRVSTAESNISGLTTNVNSISASTTANTSDISDIQSALTNVYTKSETDAHISSAVSSIDTDIFVITEQLPSSDIQTNKIYVVPAPSSATGDTNIYIEYLYDENNSAWEKIGEFKADTDLSNYSTTSQMNTAIANAVSASDKNWLGTQSQYNAIQSPDATVAYWIYEETV